MIATDARVNPGLLMACTFLGAGALQVAVRRQIPPPPWFTLVWWSWRTFMSLEEAAIAEARGDAPEKGARNEAG